MNPLKAFTPLALAAIACSIAVVGVVGYMAWTYYQRGAETAAQNGGAAAVIHQQAAAGSDASNIVANQSKAEAASEDLTRKNADAIKAAPGASASVDPGVNDAGLRALCLRHSYINTPACVRMQHARP